MKIDYIARKETLSEPVRQLIEKKTAKITKYFNDILDIRVEVDQERHLNVVEFFVRGKDFDLQSKGQNKEITAAVQEAIDKLEIQARRAKGRLKDHKARPRETEATWSVDVIEPESAASGSPRVVETISIPVKPMSIEEAVLQLEESTNDFLVFRNSTNDRVNVIYRRSDNHLGLITPEL